MDTRKNASGFAKKGETERCVNNSLVIGASEGQGSSYPSFPLASNGTEKGPVSPLGGLELDRAVWPRLDRLGMARRRRELGQRC